MKRFHSSAFTLCTLPGLSAREVLWQKDIRSSPQNFLSQVTTTIDQQYFISESSIQGNYLVMIKTDTHKIVNAKLIKNKQR